MAELEKVIKAWECCNPFNRRCFECPYDADCFHDSFDRVAIADMVKLLKEQHSISVDMFIQWCVDSQIMGEATRNCLKYWVDKFKEWKSLKDGDGE